MTKGQRIKQRRSDLNLSQSDVAKKIGVRKQTLYKYENDIVTNIPSDKIEKLASALDTTEAYLMGWDTNSTIDYMVSLRHIKEEKTDIAEMLIMDNLIDQIKPTREELDMIISYRNAEERERAIVDMALRLKEYSDRLNDLHEKKKA